MKRVSKSKVLLLAAALVVAAGGCEAPSTTTPLPPTIGDKIPSSHGAATSPAAEQLGAAPEGMANPHGSHGGASTPSAISQLAKTAAIVKVDDVTITKADLDRAMAQAAALAGIPPEMLDGEMKTAFEQPAYEKLIERNLLAKEARARKMWPGDAEVKAKREEMLESLPQGKTLQDVLAAIGADDKSFEDDLRIDVALASLLKALESEVKPVDDATVTKIYEENKHVFVVPDTASAAHILVKVDRAAGPEVIAEKKKAAEAIMKEVAGKDDATFARVAAEKSDDPSGKARGGDLGTFKKGDLFPEFEAVAFRLKEGELGGPVQTERGFHVIRGGGAEKGRELPVAEAKKIILERERVKGFLGAVDALVKRLRTAAKIERLVEPAPSPLVDPAESGSRVPAWKASGKNALPGMANPHGAPAGH
jgi:foldase protein PrsA